MAVDTTQSNLMLLEEDGIDDSTLADKPFSGLDLRQARCFGFSVPKENGWKFLAD